MRICTSSGIAGPYASLVREVSSIYGIPDKLIFSKSFKIAASRPEEDGYCFYNCISFIC